MVQHEPGMVEHSQNQRGRDSRKESRADLGPRPPRAEERENPEQQMHGAPDPAAFAVLLDEDVMRMVPVGDSRFLEALLIDAGAAERVMGDLLERKFQHRL